GLRSFSRPTGKITLALFEKIVRDVSDYTSYLTFYFQGEPYLHPQFLDMVKIASERNMYTATSTNAHFLHEKACMETIKSGLSRLIISIDGTTQETYSSYRKEGSLEKVIAGTKEIIHWKKKMNSSTPAIVWQFLVVRPNQHQIQEVQQLAKEIGVEKVALKTAQVYDYAEGNDLIPTIDKYARYKKMVDGTYSIKNKLLDQCWKMWSSCVITWDGKIVPCCFDKDAHHVVGDLNQQSFAQSWKSEPYQQFRQTLLQGRDQIEMCKNCSEGTKIWA
ncbi:MAG: radical SAM protein with 4Fe4S-binding SPASM domain, partial [Paraglaciecola sp.]